MKTPLDFNARVGEMADPNSKRRENIRRAQKSTETDTTSGQNTQNRASVASASALRELEESGDHIATKNTTSSTRNVSRVARATGASRYLQRLTKIKLKGKSSMAAIIMAIFLVGGFLTVLFSPSLAIVQMKEILTSALNDQLHAVDSRSKSLFKATMKGPASCGAVLICKSFTTMSNTEVKDFEKNKNIKIDRDMVDTEKGRVTKITFTDSNGSKTAIASDSQLRNVLKNNVEFKAAWTKGFNPQYESMSDGVVKRVLYKLKATKNQDLSGKNDEERQKKLNQASGGLQESGAKPITEKTDEDGKKTYTDENGRPLSAEQVEAAKEMEKRVEGYAASGGAAGVLKRAAGSAVMVTGTADTACSVFNGIRHVSALAKNVKKAQMARYALALVLTPADRIKAGDAGEGDTNFVGNTLMASASPTKVIDESKITQTASGKVPTKMSTDIGNAFDSKGYKLAAGEKIGRLSSNDARFSLGSVGSTKILDAVTKKIAQVVNRGNPDPKAISKKCGYIQSWLVRGGSLAVGIVTGVASLGLSTLAIGGASFALQLATPLIESTMADIVAGNITKDISGYDSGNAVYSGTAGMLGDIAENRGMEPVSTQGGAEYIAANKQTTAEYAALNSYMARTTPFDIYNRYSFMGSIVASLVPTAQQSRTSASMALMSVASIVPRSFASVLQPSTSALSDDYLGHCGDTAYKSIGIQAGPFCEVRHWMSDKELSMDPAQNAVWMAQTGNIDPTSDIGAAKDNGDDWNYVKFLEECTRRTAGWGEPQDENGGGDGSNCMKPEYKDMNEHFRVYTMDQSLKTAMTTKDQDYQELPGTTGYADNQTGDVNSDGWSFPSTKNMAIVFGYQPGHPGVDIAGNDTVNTVGQPVFAAFDGRVVAAGPSVEYGNWIVLEHKVKDQTMSTVYGYMNNDGILVRAGDTVKAGQEIGRIGNKGSGSRPYLYFELWRGQTLNNGTRIDPTEILSKAKETTDA